MQLYRERGRQRCSRVNLGGSLTIQPCSLKVVELEVGWEVLASHVTVPGMDAVEGLTSLTDRTGFLAMVVVGGGGELLLFRMGKSQ